jgi:DNA polymerase bacteriophage-type
MKTLWVDFETRSRCDLFSKGVYNYAQDGSTDVLCMSYAFDDDEVVTWRPSDPFPQSVRAHTGPIYAHNAAFERLIFWYVLQCNFQLEQFYCTATQARANCLPGSLEDVGRAISSNMRKDHRGNQLIRALSIPRADGTFNEDPALMAEMIRYCEQDVRVMREISKAMRPLSDDELADYHVNERINDRGVLLDLPLAQAAIKYAATEMEEIESLVQDITENERVPPGAKYTKEKLNSVRSPRMKQWVMARVSPQALKLMEVYKDGEKKYSIDKSVRANLLLFWKENPDEIPAHVADVIQCADDLWASSVAKFSRLGELADDVDHRVRGAFVFAGGSATGRASSYGAQVHNFTRKCADEPDDVRHAMVRGHSITPRFGKRVTDVLKGMLRPALIPAPGHSFVVSDWSAVEARVTAWASADPQADEVLQVFRDGRDLYKREAAGIYRVPEDAVDSAQRQIGKVAILSLGFGGSIGAFAAMGRNYGVIVPESDARRIVDAWRRSNAWAVRYWAKLEDAYTRALRNPGREFSAGRVTYLFNGQHLWYALPSGRVLCYPFAKFEGDEITYIKAAWKPAADAKEWPRARLWKGLACENITQAIAHDLLREALRQLPNVVLHVHDEIILESPNPEPDVELLRKVMCTAPAWAAGLPLNAEPEVMSRYGK